MSKILGVLIISFALVISFAVWNTVQAQSPIPEKSSTSPALPKAGTLRSGKIVRDASGKIVLESPGRVSTDLGAEGAGAAPAPTGLTTGPESARANDPAAPQGDHIVPTDQSVIRTPATGEGAGQERHEAAAEGPDVQVETPMAAGAETASQDAPGLPPTAVLKPGVMQRSDAGDLVLEPRKPQELRVCKPQAPQPGCGFLSLGDAVAEAQPGDTIILSSGIYEEAALITVSDLTIKGEPGAHLRRRAVEGKAALVIRADDVVIEGLECSEISVPDGNGACVRIEGRNLTLRNVYFHDNQEGVLGGVGGKVLVEDSIFERNGARRGYSHGLYILRAVEEFIFRRNKVLSTKDEGQGVKSRAQKTLIEDSVIAGLESRDSRALDIPNGGDITIRRNVLQKGPKSSNSQMIGLGLEGNLHPNNRAAIENNLIIFDGGLPDWVKIINDTIQIASPSGTAVYSRMPNVTLKNNIVVGIPRIFEGDGITEANTRRHLTRSRAGLPEYPNLPNPDSRLLTKFE